MKRIPFIFILILNSCILFAKTATITTLTARIGDYENEIYLSWINPFPCYYYYNEDAHYQIQYSTDKNVV